MKALCSDTMNIYLWCSSVAFWTASAGAGPPTGLLVGWGPAVAVVVIVGLGSAVRILLGRVDHIVVGRGGSASGSLLVQPEKSQKNGCKRCLGRHECAIRKGKIEVEARIKPVQVYKQITLTGCSVSSPRSAC